jgi:hypothetical protein
VSEENERKKLEHEVTYLEGEAHRLVLDVFEKNCRLTMMRNPNALRSNPHGRAGPKMKCEFYCNGNAIAYFVCQVCGIGLCKRHACIADDGLAYCREHKQGYV